jgi:hypothetical protein
MLVADTSTEQDHRSFLLAVIVAVWSPVVGVVVWGVRQLRRPAPVVSTLAQVAEAADLLAGRMSDAWSEQRAEQRKIKESAPVRVGWSWGSDDIALPRRQLNASPPLSTDPRPVPTTSDEAVEEQVSRSGLVTRLYEEVYARLRHGRLVLIGGPGVGKTGAMSLLLLEALRHRDRLSGPDRVNVPVPVWLTLGSWDPTRQGLREWVVATMARNHPFLRAAQFGPDAIEQLFDTGRVGLFLDGLDEMPDARRDQAMERLRTEASGRRVVLTSRPDQYRAASEAGGGLPYTAVVELRPVGPKAAADYLLEGQVGAARHTWRQVTERLKADPKGVLARTLNTPLTLSLARTAHPTDPAPLLDPGLGTERALRGHLLDQALVTAYPNPRERDHATYWLGWIAHHMNTQPDGPTRDLRWWDIPTWIPRGQLQLVSGLTVGLVSGLTVGLVSGRVLGPVIGRVLGLALGLASGLAGGFAGNTRKPQPMLFHRPTPEELRSALVDGLSFGPPFALVFVLGSGSKHEPVLMGGIGYVFGIVFGTVFELIEACAVPTAASADATPLSELPRCFRTPGYWVFQAALDCP